MIKKIVVFNHDLMPSHQRHTGPDHFHGHDMPKDVQISESFGCLDLERNKTISDQSSSPL